MKKQLSKGVTSLADAVFAELDQRIVSGIYPPGTVLTELQLSADLGVSRTPVREAIRRLQQEELVKESGKGVVVQGITKEDVADIFAIRLRIEGLAIRQLCETVTEEQLVDLGQTIELQQFYTGLGTADRIQKTDSDFHAKLYEYCGSRIFAATLSSLHRKLQRYRRLSVESGSRAEKAYLEHKAILSALRERNGDLAADRMEKHIQNAMTHILAAVKADSLADQRKED